MKNKKEKLPPIKVCFKNTDKPKELPLLTKVLDELNKEIKNMDELTKEITELLTRIDGKISDEAPKEIPLDVGIPGLINSHSEAIKYYNGRLSSIKNRLWRLV